MAEGNLLRSIVVLSEKAANIARTVRQEEHLLSLLVREKKGDEKNPRFTQDFKTLADVLVQEVVKHDLEKEFPELAGNIHGEESNEFSCLDGETICLTVGSKQEDTADQLVRILGEEKAAASLAELVHSSAVVDLDIPQFTLPTREIAIWIDPIDSTAEYFNGGSEGSGVEGVFSSGLPCVTVLIGAFHRQSGDPVLGVVNQPFNRLETDRWRGRIEWGISYQGNNLSSFTEGPILQQNDKVVIVSSSEDEQVRTCLAAGGFRLVVAAGAGYKLFSVATGLASAYVLSKPTTFFWDTCGVQALLKARGGDLVDYSAALRGQTKSLTYSAGKGIEQCANPGFIGYSSPETLQQIMSLLEV